MIESFRQFRQMIRDVTPDPEERVEPHDGWPIWRLFNTYMVRSHAVALTITLILASSTGLVMYGYAAASRFIADDIVELGLQERLERQRTHLDPTFPGEYRRFTFDQPRDRSGWSERLGEKAGKSNQEKLKLLGWLAFGLFTLEVFRHAMNAFVMERTVSLTQRMVFRLRQQVHNKLHALPMHYHDRHSPGRLMTHLFSDMTVIQTTLTTFLRQVPPSILAIVVGTVLLLYLDAGLAVYVLISLPAYTVSYRWFSRRLKLVNRDVREREGMLNGHIANRIGNFHLVKAFGRELGEAIAFLRKARPILQRHLGSSVLNTGFTVVCAIISSTCIAMILWMGAMRCRDGLMTPGELLMFYGAAGYIFNPVATLTHHAAMLHRMRASAIKIVRVLDEPLAIADPEEDAMPLPEKACEVRFENVSLTYAGMDRPAIEDVSFTLPAGHKVCVMGPSGSGKSTLAKLAARFYDPASGTIRFDGVDIRNFRIVDFRKLVGFVNQEPIVFSGTIGGNIRYGTEKAPFQSVVAAAQFAQIHDFIERLPERYRTLTHERGLTLSGGQKQRVNLARALLHDPHVLVLDDCTSALDADTEAKLLEALRTVLQGRTTLLVSHRVSIAMACEYVLMLDAGRVVQFGEPIELLRTPGAFRDLYQEQMARAKQAESGVEKLALTGVSP